MLQARRKPKGFPGADLQTVSADWKDAAPRMNVSEAQLAAFAKSGERPMAVTHLGSGYCNAAFALLPFVHGATFSVGQ